MAEMEMEIGLLESVIDQEHAKDKEILPLKKKRNLPGMPDPEAEVIALSPKTLLSTNRFVCEICNKGFQRDQNLQLHRRGHNLPWKLRKRTGKEVKKRVYVCPEPTCLHHEPARALGDLTGIKKHFCRKHGEKTYRCERCSKKYAVQSDWKAHMKTCGTRDYRCACGSSYSRRDSFVTHRAFCEALAQEKIKSKSQPVPSSGADKKIVGPASQPPSSSPLSSPNTPSTGVPSPIGGELPENQAIFHPPPELPQPTMASSISALPDPTPETIGATTKTDTANSVGSHHLLPGVTGSFTNTFAASTKTTQLPRCSSLLCVTDTSDHPNVDLETLSLSSFSSLYGGAPSVYVIPPQNPQHYQFNSEPALSATVLLQKTAQMGLTSSSPSFLRGVGLELPFPANSKDNASSSCWNSGAKVENNLMHYGPNLGLQPNPSSSLNELMMSPLGLFSNEPTTVDFLGLGLVPGDNVAPSSGGYSEYFSSMDAVDGIGIGERAYHGDRSSDENFDGLFRSKD